MNGYCAAWGPLAAFEVVHMNCEPVIMTPADDARQAVHGPTPRVCMCECSTCKRAWEEDGRPLLRDGKITRMTDDSRMVTRD